jgi:hypothetical protein
MSWDPSKQNVISKRINSQIEEFERERVESTEKTITDCLITNVFSGEEKESTTNRWQHKNHVWWILETPDGTSYTVQCGHSYDYIQSMIGNVEEQKGKYATIYYRGNRPDLGYSLIQVDRRASMPNPASESIPYSIGAFSGIFDEDALEKLLAVGYKSKNIGPKV